MFMRWLSLSLFLVILILAALWGRQRDHPPTLPPLSNWVEYDTFPWLSPGPLSFPEDHGPHEPVPLELWQLQGILASGQKTLAFQLMILALTLDPGPVQRPSRWATRRLLYAWFATTDPASGQFRVRQREDREALGLSEVSHARLTLDDWKIEFDQEEIRFVAGQRGKYLRLQLNPLAPATEMGKPSNALRAYLIAKMAATGSYGGKRVTGTAWLEHGWGRLPLPGGEVFLQRLHLQLKDGGHLACLQIQRRHGRNRGPARCLLIKPDGKPQGLKSVHLFPTSHWRNEDKKVYPIGWRLESPDLTLDIETVLPDQVIEGPLAGWSGWVIASDEHGTQGKGFMQASEVER